MKIKERKKIKKNKNKCSIVSKQKDPNNKQKILIVAQEIKFARLLSGNDKKSRDRVLKALKKWLLNCFEKGYVFKEQDFIRVWKGLFYAVWMSDKPLVQEELCENIAATWDLFPTDQLSNALMMVKAGWRVLATEWYGIDQHRIDKFMMLVRRVLRGSLRILLRSEWAEDSCRMYAEMMGDDDGILSPKPPPYARNAISLQLHLCDCLMEELAKVSKGNLPESSLVLLLEPLIRNLSLGSDLRVSGASRRALTHLIRQSDLGLQYDGKRRAWERMGCPKGGPDALELASDDEDEQGSEEEEDDDENAALDPRAGHVDALLPALPLPAAALARRLGQALRAARGKDHTRVKVFKRRFEELAKNVYPLKVRETDIDVSDPALKLPAPAKVAKRLERMHRRIMTNADDLAIRGLSRKHRKRLLAKSREGLSIADELQAIKKQRRSAGKNGAWEVEDATPAQTRTCDLADDKENVDKTLKKDKKRKANETTESPTNKKKKIELKSKDKIAKMKDKVEKKTKVCKSDSKENKSDSKETKTDSKVNKSDSVKRLTPQKGNKIKKAKEDVQIEVKKKPQLKEKPKKNFEKQTLAKKVSVEGSRMSFSSPKKVKFVLKNNSMQETIDYYKSVKQSPSIPYDSKKLPTKTNLKPSTPSPINPFFKKMIKSKRVNKNVF